MTQDGVIKYDDTNGFEIDGNTTITDGGLLTCLTLSASGLNYPTSDSSFGATLQTDGSGNLSLVPKKSKLYASVQSQNSNVSALSNDHIKFDTNLSSVGNNISLDTTSTYTTSTGTASIGRITLTSGFTYYINATLYGFTGTTIAFSIWDATNNVVIENGTLATTAGNLSGVSAVYSPSSNILMEIRFSTTTLVTDISRAFIVVKQL